jgi:ABC-type lipoprotein release transport system permease subunit
VATAFLLRAQIRSRWRSWLVLAILAGVVAGTLLATLTGARRTETAYTRFLKESAAFDVAVTNGATTPDNVNRQFDLAEVARLPEVADAAGTYYYSAFGTTPSGRRIVPNDLAPLASTDGKFGKTLNRARVLEGRMPIANDELAISPLAAQRLRIGVGDTLHLYLGGVDALFAPPPGAQPRNFRVVGLVAAQGGFPPLTGGLGPIVLLSPTYAATHPPGAQVLALRLRHGNADLASFMRRLARLAPGQHFVTTSSNDFSAITRSLSVQANALRIAALLAGIVFVLVLAQVLVLVGFSQAADDETLHALGVMRRQLGVLALLRSFVVAGIAMVVAVATAVLLSPLAPVGVGRDAEPHPGVAVNRAYVGLGAVAVLVVVMGMSVAASMFAARRRTRATTPGRAASVGRVLATMGASTAATTGVTMALEPGRGRSAVPVRSTIVSATLAVAMIAGVLGFTAGLTKLFDHPKLYGWNWDIQVGDSFAPSQDREAARLDANSAAEAVAIGTTERVEVRGQQVDLLAIESRKGSITPTMIAGRAAAEPDEIVLGTRTLRDAGRGIGDFVDVALGDTTARYKIVGRAVFPDFAGSARLGDGAQTTFAGVRRLQRDAPADLVLVRVTPDARGAALLDRLAQRPGVNIYLPVKPADLAELDRIGGLPSVLAALLAVMAIGTLAYALASSVRRRRRDLAILKVLGFPRAKVSASVAWQANAIAAIAIVIGIPVGIVAGQLAWRLFANQLGVPARPAVSAIALGVVVVATLVLANLTALIPARLAARTRASVALRAE